MPDSDIALSSSAVALREPQSVLKLRRMGAAFPTRLSLMRILTRRMARENWSFAPTRFDVDANGLGTAVWRIGTPAGELSFVAFSTPLKPEERTDRVIAEKWDMTAALCRGPASADDVERLRANAPRQEAGRYTSRELVLTRANRSVRLFDTVVHALAAGRQPDWSPIISTGYLMRTTAVYGNGKFGLADYPCTVENPSVAGGFMAEMLTVYLVREFQIELANRLAAATGASATRLDADHARALGVGNATGLGMAPFLARHPHLLHSWARTREEALRLMLSRPAASAAERTRCQALLERALAHVRQWSVDDVQAMERIATVREEIAALLGRPLADERPFLDLYRFVERTMSIDTQELVVALLIELGGDEVNALEAGMLNATAAEVRPSITLARLMSLIEERYGWALDLDRAGPEARTHFWYYSANKDEPRLGRRESEPGAEHEMPVGTALDIAALHERLATLSPEEREETVARFLLREPVWYRAAKRAMLTAALPYADVCDNLLGAGMRPVDILRFKLSIFGASRFDPKSDLWTRVTMFQGAPLASELQSRDADDWWLPVFGDAA
ncbi:MAG: hypothetical protein U1E46_17905 [Hyphomicrobiales bacterium]